MKKKPKHYNPGRIPTAKGSIRHKSDKDYKRKDFKEAVKEIMKEHSKLFKRLRDTGD